MQTEVEKIGFEGRTGGLQVNFSQSIVNLTAWLIVSTTRTGVARAGAPRWKVVAASLHSANAASRSAATNGATLARGSSASAAPDSSGSSSGAPWKAEPSNGDWPMDWMKIASLRIAREQPLHTRVFMPGFHLCAMSREQTHDMPWLMDWMKSASLRNAKGAELRHTCVSLGSPVR
jgi:hypothetical protein